MSQFHHCRRAWGVSVALGCCMVFLASLPLWGQLVATGSISGTVHDPSGASVPGAKVTAIDTGTGAGVTTETNNTGSFVFTDLPVGTYTVTVSKTGFETHSTTGISLHPGIVSNVIVSLGIGKTSAKVTVRAPAVQVQTSTSEISSEVSGEQAATLPLNGRNYMSLSALMPGVTNTSPAQALGQGTANGGNGNVMSINGMGVSGTLYTVDGIWNMNTGNMTGTTIMPDPDTIQEIRVFQSNYSVQNSLFGSNAVVVETKSGTDTFHGTAFEYLRNDGLDARNFFSPTVPALKQNIFGYTLGGPIYIPHHFNTNKQKLFFFLSQQWIRQNSASVLTGATPTAAMRNGTFNTKIIDPATKQPFPQTSPGVYQIPASMINPSALVLMNTLASLPNNPGGGFNNYINLAPTINDQLDDEGKVDYYLNDRLRLTGEYFRETENVTLPHDGADLGSPFDTNHEIDEERNQLAELSLTQTLSPSMVNTTRIAMNNYNLILSLGPLNFLNEVPDFHEVLPFQGGAGSNRLPKITFSGGWSSFGTPVNRPLPHASDLEDTFSDDWSWLRGNHYLQSGFNLVLGTKRQNTFANSQGTWSFNGQFTGNPIADYLLGYASGLSQQSTTREPYLKYPIASPYIQDRWRMTPRLTLTAGLRIFYMPFDHDQRGFIDSFDSALYNPAEAPIVNNNGTITKTPNYNPTNGLVYNGLNGVPLTFANKHNWDFGPQIGFAWDLFGDGRTALRGGYGITYNRIIAQCTYNCVTNPPFVQSISLVNPRFPDALATTAGVAPAGAPGLSSLYSDAYPAGQVQTYSLSLEHQFSPNWLVSVAGAGNIAHHLGSSWNIEQPLPDPPYDFNPVLNTGNVSSAVLAPYLGYSSINMDMSTGNAYWNALEVSARHPVGHNIFLTVAYTYQHETTTYGGGNIFTGGGPQNIYNPGVSYGTSTDTPFHMLAISHIWALPWYQQASGWKGLVLGGWKYTGITTIQSGFPMNVGLTGPHHGLTGLPDRVETNVAGPKTINEWFNTAAFVAPPPGYFGNASIGTLTGPGLVNFDMGFYKDFKIRERATVEFRGELFNIFNHTNFSGVSTSVGAGNYGRITSARDPRIAEFALRLQF